MAMYSSPTTRNAPEAFPPAYHSQHPPPPSYPTVGVTVGAVPGGSSGIPTSPLKSRTTRNLCQNFMATGTCPNGESCPFSHGRQEPGFEGGRQQSPSYVGGHHDHHMYPGSGVPTSPAGGPPRRAFPNHQAPAHHSHPPPPPPYGAPPPPPYDVVHHGGSGMLPPPPPPSYEEHMAAGSRHGTPSDVRDGSPRREVTDTPGRFRHDPYSPDSSRIASPNRRD